MESIRSLTQTMMTTSSNIVETFVYIPFVEDSEMTIDLLVQKTVVHNFLPIPQSTFPMLPSTVHMESTSSSTQTLNTSSNIVETFAYIPFVEAQEMRIDLLVQKNVVHNFSGFRKVRFQRYRPQFKWNQAVRLPTQGRLLLVTSLKLSFICHL